MTNDTRDTSSGLHDDNGIGLPAITPSDQVHDHDSMSVMILGWNFATAMTKWALAAFPCRSQEEITARFAICQSCEHFQNQQCMQCGCLCNEKNHLMNKLTLATETCPVGKWR